MKSYSANPNVIEIVDIKLEDVSGFVFPKAEMTLYDFIKNIKRGDRVRLCQEMAKGMAHLYKLDPKVFHRGLTSKNVLVFRRYKKAILVVSEGKAITA